MEVRGSDDLLFGEVGVPATLPRGRSGLPRDVVVMSQHARLLEGIVAAVAAKGYSTTSVADVIAHAGVSRATFYEHFSDKEDCFLAAYESGARVHFEYVVGAVRRTPGRIAQLRAAIWAFVELLAAQPTYAKTFLIEVNGAGPRALALRLEAQRRYAEVFRQWHRAVTAELSLHADVPDEAFLGAVLAISELTASRIFDGRPLDPAELTPVYVHIVLALGGLAGIADEARP